MKKLYAFVMLILLSVVMNAFFFSPNIIDVATGEKMYEISLEWPVIRMFVEPFYAVSYYIFNMEPSEYWFSLISWLFWAVLVTFLVARYKKVNMKKTAVFCSFSFFFIISIVCMVFFLPASGPKITHVDGYKVIDVHSHTVASRDSISTMMSGIEFHNLHGFTDFFVTEHDNTKSYGNIPIDIGTDHIFPGIEVRAQDGTPLILLSQYKFRYEDFKGKTVRDMIAYAHSRDMLVIVPNWWEIFIPDLQQLVEMGVDGFEIYNGQHKAVSPKDRQAIINICKEHNLIMVGSTDWHGLGYMANCWTLVREKGDKNIVELLKDKPQTKVVIHDVPNAESASRFFFEPLYFLLSYSIYTPLKYVMSFYAFIFVIAAFLYKVSTMKIVRAISLYMSFVFCLSTFYFVKMLTYSFFTNTVIPGTILPICISLVFVWLIIWSFCDKDI